MTTAERTTTPNGTATVPAAVITVLREALLALGEAGHPIRANRLAARAWSSLRSGWPEHAETLNRTMHVLARLEAARPGETDDARTSPVPQPPTTQRVQR
jgi:hypothetical protein